MHKILVITLYFALDVLHVSDYISPSPGGTFYKLYIAFGIFSPSYNHTTARRIGIHQIRCTAYRVAPDDGLI